MRGERGEVGAKTARFCIYPLLAKPDMGVNFGTTLTTKYHIFFYFITVSAHYNENLECVIPEGFIPTAFVSFCSPLRPTYMSPSANNNKNH
jgi:hypothetical protein